MSKEQDSDNKKAKLTDAELQQATGGSMAMTLHKKYCEAQGDQTNCEKKTYCKWKEGKNGYYCDYYPY